MSQQFCYTNIVPFITQNHKKKYIYQDLSALDHINIDTNKKRKVRIYYEKDHYIEQELGLPVDSYQLNVLYKFLAIHMSLKNQRNLINHANGTDDERVKIEVLKAAIQKYMKFAKELGIE